MRRLKQRQKRDLRLIAAIMLIAAATLVVVADLCSDGAIGYLTFMAVLGVITAYVVSPK